ncbi:MAG: FtsX-like permease family protein [Ignisphaera sp.]
MAVTQFVFDVFKLAFKTLTERKMRATLTIIGIAIGPLALVMISSVIDGYADYVITQIEGLGQNAIVLFPESGYKFSDSDLNAIRALPGVERAEPFYSIQAQVKVGTQTKVVFVYAIPVNIVFEAIRGLEVSEGSIPSDSDYLKAVVGYKIAYDDNNNKVYDIGDVITITYLKTSGGKTEIKRASISVSAILKEFGGAFILSPDTTIFLPLSAGQKVLGLNEWSGIFVLAERSEYVPILIKQLQQIYGNSASIISFQSIANIASSIIGAMNFISFAASLSAFAVAVAGVASTMITSVIERTREIGVLKALGFTDLQVLVMILMESIVMSLIGAAIGISLGVMGAHALASRGFEIRAAAEAIMVVKAAPKVSTYNIARTLGLTILVGIGGGILPAYRAAKIPPAVALRYE